MKLIENLPDATTGLPAERTEKLHALIDELLRGERGLMVAQALQKRLGAVPVLVVTGDTRERTRRELEAAGLAVIYKPLDGWRLARHISNAKGYMNSTATRASRWEPR